VKSVNHPSDRFSAWPGTRLLLRSPEPNRASAPSPSSAANRLEWKIAGCRPLPRGGWDLRPRQTRCKMREGVGAARHLAGRWTRPDQNAFLRRPLQTSKRPGRNAIFAEHFWRKPTAHARGTSRRPPTACISPALPRRDPRFPELGRDMVIRERTPCRAALRAPGRHETSSYTNAPRALTSRVVGWRRIASKRAVLDGVLPIGEHVPRARPRAARLPFLLAAKAQTLDPHRWRRFVDRPWRRTLPHRRTALGMSTVVVVERRTEEGRATRRFLRLVPFTVRRLAASGLSATDEHRIRAESPPSHARAKGRERRLDILKPFAQRNARRRRKKWERITTGRR